MLLSRSRSILQQFRPILGQIRKFSVPSSSVPSNISRPPLVQNQSPLVTDVLTKENSDGVLQVVWDDGTTSTFSAILLRDNCRCSQCYDKQAQQRMLDTHFIPLDIVPRDVQICNQYVSVTWPDDHKSSYTHDDFVSTSKDDDITNIKPILWEKKEVESNIPTFNFESVLESDTVKYDWFQALCIWGFTLLQGAGTELNGLDRLKTLFGGYFKTSQYGDTLQVMVHADDEVNSLAQRPDGVLPHMDLSHFEYFPGFLALHCLKQSGSGGDSTLIDGFKVAQELKEKEPKAYDLLANYRVAYRDAGSDIRYGDFDTRYERPVIGEKDGEIYNIGYSNWSRDYRMNGNAEEIQKFYKSYHKFTSLLNDPKYELTYKLKPGEMFVVNNRRMLHGRTAFGMGERIERHLHGCFLDWDGLLGYMRPVKKRLDDANL